MFRSRTARSVAALVAIVVSAALGAAPAFAHVDAESTEAAGGATSLTFSFTHGCGASPTTSLRVQLPAGTTGVKAENPAGFTSTATNTEIAWTGGSIPTDVPGSFTATMTLAGKPGDVVYLPTIQGCATGEEAWIDKTPDPEAERAAPRITLGAAATPTTAGADHDRDTDESSTTAPSTTATPTTSAAGTTSAKATSTGVTVAPATSTTASSTNVGLIVGVVILALVVGGGVFAMMRRRGASPDA